MPTRIDQASPFSIEGQTSRTAAMAIEASDHSSPIRRDAGHVVILDPGHVVEIGRAELVILNCTLAALAALLLWFTVLSLKYAVSSLHGKHERAAREDAGEKTQKRRLMKSALRREKLSESMQEEGNASEHEPLL